MNINKTFFFSKNVICCLLFAFLFVSGMYAQSCDAQLMVEKNRNSKSADEDGAVYNMVLTNTSSAVENYSISVKQLEGSCSNVAYKTSAANVDLDVAISGNAARTSGANEISVKPGQSYNFTIKVTVPKGTPSKRWSCIQVEAKSPSCKGKAASTVLKVFVPDVTEG